MTEVLHAWIQDEYVGYFEKVYSTQDARFFYDSGARRHVSLSLPMGVEHRKRAAQHYLDGLIPEDSGARENMRNMTKARSTSSWDLLYAVEGDLPGGILLQPDKSAPIRGTAYVRRATTASIAARVALIHDGGTGFDGIEGKPRFSLAGAQGKFALARTSDGLNFWPDPATPSTHIVKPARQEHPGLNEIEARSLALARVMGLKAAYARVENFAGQEAFVVERFDRLAGPNDTFTRVHVEDLVQALGRSPERKYEVSVRDAVEILRTYGRHDNDHYEFIQQLAFNVAIGNADAHGKNYSLIHDRDKVSLSPLYDTVPIALYPHFNQYLGMKIGKKKELAGVVPSDWIELAKLTAMDSDRVLEIVRRVEEAFLANVDPMLTDTELGRLRRTELEKLISRTERSVKTNPV